MTDDVGEKSALTPAGDSWLSAALYLLSLWGSHGRSLEGYLYLQSVNVLPLLDNYRGRRVAVVSARCLSPWYRLYVQPGLFFSRLSQGRISTPVLKPKESTGMHLSLFLMLAFLHLVIYLQLSLFQLEINDFYLCLYLWIGRNGHVHQLCRYIYTTC